MIRTHQCITLACDRCSYEFHEEDDYICHFGDLDAARKAAEAVDWVVTGTQVMCAGCAAKAACALTGGHTLGERVELKSEQYSGTVQRCESCGTGYYDPPLLKMPDEEGGR
ncbi:hypothetical protein AB0J47_41840 [Nocardia sp. NPDC049737]|uniref:hypothetical protein n=1 Tax=Nocardia sp. NPDC049737 TaxID=3154358 RepID=UPI003438F53A